MPNPEMNSPSPEEMDNHQEGELLNLEDIDSRIAKAEQEMEAARQKRSDEISGNVQEQEGILAELGKLKKKYEEYKQKLEQYYQEPDSADTEAKKKLMDIVKEAADNIKNKMHILEKRWEQIYSDPDTMEAVQEEANEENEKREKAEKEKRELKEKVDLVKKEIDVLMSQIAEMVQEYIGVAHQLNLNAESARELQQKLLKNIHDHELPYFEDIISRISPRGKDAGESIKQETEKLISEAGFWDFGKKKKLREFLNSGVVDMARDYQGALKENIELDNRLKEIRSTLAYETSKDYQKTTNKIYSVHESSQEELRKYLKYRRNEIRDRYADPEDQARFDQAWRELTRRF